MQHLMNNNKLIASMMQSSKFLRQSSFLQLCSFLWATVIMIYWIEFHQKPIIAVRCSLAYIVRWHLTSPRHLKQTRRKDMGHGKKIHKGCHWTILVNTKQYYAMLDNIRIFLTILDNIITFLRISLQLRKERAKGHLNNIEHYLTIFYNIVQYCTTLDNI